MKILCHKNELLKSINIVIKAVPAKTTMDILQCILIDATMGNIKFTANDMELGIETIVTGTILEPGMIALDARLFSEMIRKLPENDVIISSGDDFVTVITCEKAKFTIVGKDGTDFVTLPYMEREESITLSQFTLKEIIRQTIFSIAANESNKIMTGELFEISGNRLNVYSLDGHRISIRKVELAGTYEPVNVIIPGKTLNEIARILSGEADQTVTIYFGENQVLFSFDDTIVLSRLIDGKYFNVNQMLSHDYETKVTVNKKDFLECIDRSTLMVKENDKKPIIFDIQENNMNLMIRSQLGTMSEDLDIVLEGKDIRIGFNPRFIMDALRVIDDEEVTIYFMNSKAPCIFRNAQESYIYLILPVNFIS